MTTGMQDGAQRKLRGTIERIERLEADKADIAADIRAEFANAKSEGFDVKVMRQVLKERKQDAAERNEYESVLDVYRHALGMLADTPLGEAAIERERVAA